MSLVLPKSYSKTTCFVLFLILLYSLVLNLWNNDFPLGYHPDEAKKVRFIEQSQQDFYHPILLLQVVRSLNFVIDIKNSQHLAELGRTVSGILGTALVAISFFIAKRRLTPQWALIFAFALATSPILVIHSHYLKEDIIFVCFLMLSLLLLLRCFDWPTKTRFFLFGIAAGLTISSKYIGFIIFPIYLLAPIIYRCQNKKNIYIGLLFGFIIALISFLIINLPLFKDVEIFMKGLSFETNHALNGHSVITPIPIYFYEYWFSYYVVNGLIPGITGVLTLLGIGYLLYVLFLWKRASNEDRLFSFFLLCFYLVIEISPLKTTMRYVMPLVPLFILFSCCAVIKIMQMTLESLLTKKIASIGVLIVFSAGLVYETWDTLHLDYYLAHDTRAQLVAWYQEKKPSEVVCEHYTGVAKRANCLGVLNLEEEKLAGVKYLVASKLNYNRFYVAKNLHTHTPKVDEIYNAYEYLFSLPYIEIKPTYKSFDFSNPVIRIISIEQDSRSPDV